jgi:hypothetical protein
MPYKYVYYLPKITKTMPISIPTSIAGISVPGTINGPLQLLYGNKFKFDGLKYPRNLGTDATRSHVIKFTSYAPIEKYSSQIGTNVGTLIKSAGDVTRVAGQNAIIGAENLANRVGGTGTQQAYVQIPDGTRKAVGDIANEISAADVPRQPDTSIALYIPDTVNVSYGASYDDISLTESLGKAYFLAQTGTSMLDLFSNNGDKMSEQFANKAASDPFIRYTLANAAGKALGMSNVGDLVARGMGEAINPQLQVLFRGVGFRTFQFDFVFTPYSKEETEEVRKIIEAFKYAAAPEINPLGYFSQGVFMKVPYPFKIQFFYKGQENPYVHRIGETVLENINVDYGPNGWSTFNDGSPVQIKMTLQFKETVVVDKNRIKAGY